MDLGSFVLPPFWKTTFQHSCGHCGLWGSHAFAPPSLHLASPEHKLQLSSVWCGTKSTKQKNETHKVNPPYLLKSGGIPSKTMLYHCASGLALALQPWHADPLPAAGLAGVHISTFFNQSKLQLWKQPFLDSYIYIYGYIYGCYNSKDSKSSDSFACLSIPLQKQKAGHTNKSHRDMTKLRRLIFKKRFNLNKLGGLSKARIETC